MRELLMITGLIMGLCLFPRTPPEDFGIPEQIRDRVQQINAENYKQRWGPVLNEIEAEESTNSMID